MELLKQKQSEDPPRIGEGEDLPRDLSSLADAMIQRVAEKRPTAQEIVEFLGLDLDSRTSSSASHASSLGSSRCSTCCVLV